MPANSSTDWSWLAPQTGGGAPGYGSTPPTTSPNNRLTLRQIAEQRGLNVDWNRMNSTEGGGDTAYRQSIMGQLGDQYNPYGTLGAAGLDPMGRAGEVDVTMIPDDIRGTRWEAMAQRLGATDAASLRGMLARGRGQELYQGDRGDYNEYVADLGNMIYDPEAGWVPGEGGFNQGDRVGRSFSNMRVWGPAAVLAIGGGMNALGAEGAGGGAGVGGGAGGASAEAATGAFDTAGWAGSGINGATGTAINPAVAAGTAGVGGGAAGGAATIPGTSVPSVSGLANNAIAASAAPAAATTAATSIPAWAQGFIDMMGGPSGLARAGISLAQLLGSGPGTPEGAQNAANQAAATADPFAPLRPEFQQQLRDRFQELINFDPNKIKDDPAYQFQLEQGEEALNRASAASGMYRSGNRGTELTKFGQGLASSFTEKQFARNQQILSTLAQLSGVNVSNPVAAAQLGLSGFTGATNLQNNATNQIFSWLTGGGTGQAAPIDRFFNWLMS